MYIQGKNETPMEFLRRAHGEMVNKYLLGQSVFGSGVNVEQERKDAEELQSFLIELKQYAQLASLDQQNPNPVGHALTIANIYNRIKTSYKSGSEGITQTLFHRFNGFNLEDELSRVIKATFEEGNINLDEQGIGSLVVGQLTGTSDVDFNRGIAEQFSKAIGKNTKVAFERIAQTSESGKTKRVKNLGSIVRLTGVEQKIDVSGANLSLNFSEYTEDQYLLRIMNILNKATITAKNYGSSIEKLSTLKLGQTDPLRSISAALKSLGISDSEINFFFEKMIRQHKRYSKYDNFKKYLFGLQFAYELTGVGINTGAGIDLQGAKYLIYNNPSTNEIYVQSTSYLIQQMLESPEHWMPPDYDPFSHYKISVARKADFWKK